MGIVGMIVYRLQTQHPSLANCAVFTNLASKHAALEKNVRRRRMGSLGPAWRRFTPFP